jgi:non-specific protein-tyrosine kinase
LAGGRFLCRRNKSLEIRRYLRILRRWWWLLVAATVIAATGSYLATRSQPRIYSSRARVMVGQSIQSVNPDWMSITTAQQLALTYVELATTRAVLQEAIDSLNLQSSPDILAGMVSAKPVENTQLLDITVVDTDPVRAAAIANAVGDALVSQPLQGSGGAEADLRQDVLEQMNDLKGRIAFAKDEVQNLDAAILEEQSARAIAELKSRRDLLQQQIGQWQMTYAQLFTAYTGNQVNTLTVVERAEPNYAPIGPRTTTNVALAGAIGALLAVGAILLLEYLDDTIKTTDELATLTGLTFLGIIPRIPESKASSDRLVTLNEPRSNFSECFRVLRTNLQFSSYDRPLRTIVVTSPQPTEGKSTTAANLAVVLAQAGLRVVLVDTDLRRPVLHKIFDLPNDWGLTGALFGEYLGTKNVLFPTQVDNLSVIPSGPLPPNPSEILGSQRMESFIEDLKQRTDVIIFDSPPLLTVTDSTVLATKAEGVVLVVDSGTTRRDALQKAVDTLRKVGAHILGTVLNRVNTRSGGYYYYYYSHYYDESGQKKRRRKRADRQHGAKEAAVRPIAQVQKPAPPGAAEAPR